MELGILLDDACALEERTAALYARFARAGSAAEARLFETLAEEERAHARGLLDARAGLDPVMRWRVSVDGWREALDDVRRRVAAGEALPADAPIAARLGAALDIELSEIDELRQRLLSLTGRGVAAQGLDAHGSRLASCAPELTDDPHVQMQATLLRLQTRGTRGR